MRIEMHTKSHCPYCDRAKSHLQSHGIPFTIIGPVDDWYDRQRVYDTLGLQGNERTMPQVIVVEADGTRVRIGGCQSLLTSDLVARYQVHASLSSAVDF